MMLKQAQETLNGREKVADEWRHEDHERTSFVPPDWVMEKPAIC